jgi:hypothetical protein
MPPAIDLVRHRYGRLLVVWLDEPYRDLRGISHRRYVCRCDCGAVVSVRANSLTGGETRSCGCLAAELKAERSRARGARGAWTPATSGVLASLESREREWTSWLRGDDDGRLAAPAGCGA